VTQGSAIRVGGRVRVRLCDETHGCIRIELSSRVAVVVLGSGFRITVPGTVVGCSSGSGWFSSMKVGASIPASKVYRVGSQG